MTKLVRGIGMSVFTLLMMVLFALVVYGVNTITSLYDSTLLCWDVGKRALGRAWEGEGPLG